MRRGVQGRHNARKAGRRGGRDGDPELGLDGLLERFITVHAVVTWVGR